MTAALTTDAVHIFCAPVDPTGELAAAVRTAAYGDYDVDEILRFGNLRTPRWSLAGAQAEAAAVTRRVANRDVDGFLDPQSAQRALDAGAVLCLRRPDLLAGPPAEAQRPLTALLDAGRLELTDLVLHARAQQVHAGDAGTAMLVVQVRGTSTCRTPDGGCELPAGAALTSTGPVTLSPRTDGVVRVLARRVPTGADVRRAVGAAFLAHLRDTGADDVHHLIAPQRRAQWLREQWCGFRDAHDRAPANTPIDVAGTRTEPLPVTVAPVPGGNRDA